MNRWSNLMILSVINAKYINDYRVEVSFSDGKIGTVDLKDSLQGPIFTPLKDKSVFSQLRMDQELDTIVWPNGADFAPEYLYFKAFKDAPDLQHKFKKWGYIA